MSTFFWLARAISRARESKFAGQLLLSAALAGRLSCLPQFLRLRNSSCLAADNAAAALPAKRGEPARSVRPEESPGCQNGQFGWKGAPSQPASIGRWSNLQSFFFAPASLEGQATTSSAPAVWSLSVHCPGCASPMPPCGSEIPDPTGAAMQFRQHHFRGLDRVPCRVAGPVGMPCERPGRQNGAVPMHRDRLRSCPRRRAREGRRTGAPSRPATSGPEAHCRRLRRRDQAGGHAAPGRDRLPGFRCAICPSMCRG